MKKNLKLYSSGEPRYREALKIVATLGATSWSEVRRGIEARLGKITDSKLSIIFRKLMDSGFIRKEGNKYTIVDPILRRGVLTYL